MKKTLLAMVLVGCGGPVEETGTIEAAASSQAYFCIVDPATGLQTGMCVGTSLSRKYYACGGFASASCTVGMAASYSSDTSHCNIPHSNVTCQ